MKLPTDISRLIGAKILNQPLSEAEQQQLDTWLQASEANQALYKQIESLQSASQIIKLDKEEYGRKMAARFKQTISFSAENSNRRKRLYTWLGSAAAVALLILSVTLYKNHQPETEVIKKTAIIIQPGKTGAILTLANGESIQLDQSHKEVGKLIDSLYVADAHKAKSVEQEYHTLSIPAGEEFFYQLDDNTSVWLNSQTELRFPKEFKKEERKVYLKGEAFFDVAKDSKRPFIVSMEQGDIKVYGTRFNITNYAESPLSAVLVEGSIGFTTLQGKEVRIKPSEKLTYEQDKAAINICTVDTSLYTAWIEHLFIFNGQPLEEIMTNLSRWYNFKVSFASDDIRHIRLSGRLYRHEDIRVLLDSYETTTGLRFEIKDRTILITK